MLLFHGVPPSLGLAAARGRPAGNLSRDTLASLSELASLKSEPLRLQGGLRIITRTLRPLPRGDILSTRARNIGSACNLYPLGDTTTTVPKWQEGSGSRPTNVNRSERFCSTLRNGRGRRGTSSSSRRRCRRPRRTAGGTSRRHRRRRRCSSCCGPPGFSMGTIGYSHGQTTTRESATVAVTWW
jgi:hypothetical protein